MRTCISHESALIRQIVSYGIHFARSESPVGHNVLFCAGRYNSTINSILYGSFNDIVSAQFNSTMDEAQLRTVSFLLELIEIRDSRHEFYNQLCLTKSELNDIVTFICTC